MADRDERDRLQDRLKGRLSEDDAAAMDEAIDKDPHQKAEYRLIAALNDTDTATHPFPGELGWARLAKELDEDQKADESTEQRGDAQERGVAPAVALNKRAPWRRPVPLWQAAACVVAAVVAWQMVAPEFLGSPDEPARFVTATGPAAVDVAGPSVRVAFAPDANEEAIRTLLRSTGARIVDGPSALGLYTLAFEGEAERASAIEEYAASGAVDLVDPR